MSQVSEITVRWTPETSGRVSGIQIESRIVGGTWSVVAESLDPAIGVTTFTSNAPGAEVEVRARYRMISGVFGPYDEIDLITAEIKTPWVDIIGDDRPDDNATVGAPEWTNIGDKPVPEVLNDIGNAKGNAQTAVDALKNTAGQIVPVTELLGDISDLQTVYGDTASSKANAEAAAASQAVAQSAASNASQAFTDSKTARDAAQAAQALALTNANTATGAKNDAQTALAGANTAKTAAESAKTAAETARTNAQTAQTASETAKGLSQTAQTAAQTARDAAATSATNATSTFTNTTRTAAQLFPSDFSRLGQFFTRANDGQNVSSITADASNSFPTDSKYGVIYQMNANGSAYGGRVSTVGYFQPVAGRRYRAEAIVNLVSVNTTTGTTVSLAQRANNSSFAYATDYAGGLRNSLSTVGVWTTLYHEFDGSALLAQNVNVVYSRPYVVASGTAASGNIASFDGVLQIASFRFLDITEVYNAQTSATAAAGSASTATTKASEAGSSATSATGSANTATTKAQNASDSATAASNSASAASSSSNAAGQSASAAKISETNASTKAGEASTSASNSAGSESNALGSKNAAAASASQAANSATAAGGSATAANTSAGTATTQAGLAGNSATAANTANVAATSAAMGASYLDVAYAWDFTGSALNGFGAGGATLTAGANGALLTNTGTDPIFVTPTVSILGSRYTRVVVDFVRVTARTAGNWEANMYWNNANHGESGTYVVTALNKSLADVAVGERAQLIFDINSAPSVASADWLGSTTTRLRFDFDNGAAGSAAVRILSVRVLGADGMAPAKNASAAAGSASTATTKATEAGQSASAAKTSETNAGTKAGEASTSASAASSSASDALGSKNAAGTSATNAATSASQAGGSATAAGTSATNAGTSATNAGNSATAANLSAVSAASSFGAATLTASALMPSDFNLDGRFFTANFGGNPATNTSLAADSTFSYQTVSGIGRVLQVSVGPGASVNAANFGVIRLVAGRKYRVSTRARVTAAAAGSAPVLYAMSLNSNYGYTPSASVSVGITATTSWTDTSVVIDGTAAIANGGVWLRANVATNTTASAPATTIFQYQFILVEDITESSTAAAQAAAAVTSASTATTKANEAGQSASAAKTSETNASTSAGNASTYANNASTSASNALGSANTATTQAGVASSSQAAAVLTAVNMHPTTFEQGISFFGGDGGSLTPGATLENSGGVNVFRNTSSNSYDVLTWKTCVVNKPANKWKVRARVGNIQGVASSVEIRLAGYTLQAPVPGSRSSYQGAGRATPADGFIWVEAVFDAPDVNANPFVRPEIVINYGPGVTDTFVRVMALELADVTGETNAAGSATAAAGSASTATTKANEAGQSASAASGSATAASTSAGNAGTSASQASTSASNALGSANSAASSATVSATTAKDSAADNVNDGRSPGAAMSLWSYNDYNNTAPLLRLSNDTNFTTVNGQLRINSGAYHVHPVAPMRVQDGKRYRAYARVRLTADGSQSAGHNLYVTYWDINGNLLAGNTVLVQQIANFTVADGFKELSRDISTNGVGGSAVMATGTAFMRVMYRSSGAPTEVALLYIEDVEAQRAAQDSATASAGSASTASASKDAAGQSASAANTSATNAGTSAGQAATSASNASTSASNALGSANTASTQAGLAAGSANGAAGSANAANTSAGTAGTAATNAGTSASAAQTSNLSAIATALNMHPTTFEQKELFFGGDGGSTVPIGTFENVSGVWTIRNNDGANYGTVSWKTCVANKVGKWKVRAKVGNISGIASAVQLRISSYATQAPTGNRISYAAADRPTPANGFTWVEAIFDGADVINNPWVKPELIINYGSGTTSTLVRVMALELVDVTGEVNAGASATLAATSASTASTKADAASGSASTATTAASNAASYRDAASTSASNASTSANNASSSAASASTSATISSSYSGSSFTINDKFANWTNAASYPVGYSTWTAGGNWRFERQPGYGSAYCIRTLNDVPNVNSGFQQSFTIHNGVWVVEATVMLDGGTWSGAGMSVSGVFNYHFASEPDTNGVVSSNTGAGSVRTWSKMFTNNNNIGTAATLYGMHGWEDGFRGVDPKYLRWYSLRVRPATSGEIQGGAALTLSNTNTANISTLTSTVASNQQALASRATTLEARAFAGGNQLSNTIFPNANTAGWSTSNYGGGVFGWAVNFAGDNWHPVGENVLGVYQSNRAGGDTKGRWHSERMTITGGAYYCIYVQSASHRALNEVIAEWYRADGSSAGVSYSGQQWTGGGGNTAAGFAPLGFKSVQAPSDAVQLVMTLSKSDTVAGQSDSYAWFWRPYIGLARPNQDEYNPYSPGSGSAVLNAVAARVTQSESVVAGIDGKVKAYLTQEVSAGDGRAIVSVRADGQTGSSNIDLAASQIRLLTPGANNGYTTALSVDSGEAVFAGKLRVGLNKSGARTEIETNQIRVYDANGTMRVRLGVW